MSIAVLFLTMGLTFSAVAAAQTELERLSVEPPQEAQVASEEPSPVVTDGASERDPSPHFQEVLRLIRGNLAGVTEQELNRAMVDGLLRAFHPRVIMVSPETNPEPAASIEPLGPVKTFQDMFAYLRVRAITSDLPRLFSAALEEVLGSPRYQGLVIDLRAADGQDYHAAAATADLFVSGGKPLLQWDDQTLTSSGPGLPQPVFPLALLVNGETGGAAEALAGALHESAPAVLIGSRTAGRAFAMRTFRLDGDQELLIAGAPVLVGEDRSLAEGVDPDLEIVSDPAADRKWLEDPYHVPEGTEAAGVANRRRFDEAELIREHNGDSVSGPGAAAAAGGARQPASPVLQDPALVRALAVLTGVTRVRGGIRR